jgi:hypothetical protein
MYIVSGRTLRVKYGIDTVYVFWSMCSGKLGFCRAICMFYVPCWKIWNNLWGNCIWMYKCVSGRTIWG